MSSFTKPFKYTELKDKYKRRNLYRVDEAFDYLLGSVENPIGVITIPKGFITDFASIPWPLYLLFNPEGPWAKAATVHDYLINETWKGDYQTFAVANAIFKEAMLVSGVSTITTNFFFAMVSLYGLIRPFRSQHPLH